MKEWLEENRGIAKLLFWEYGKISFASICIAVSLVSILFIISSAVPQKLKISFLDVGQGDAIFLQTPSGHDMLIDGGPTNKILERLGKEMNYFDRDIDVVVATHPDADHVTGLIPVLEKYNVRTIVVSPTDGSTGVFTDLQTHIDNEGADIHVARTGDRIDFGDGVTATVLYPPKNYIPKKNDTNDASVSMVITYGNHTFLLTGDLPSSREPKLIGALLSLRTSASAERKLVGSSANSNITVYKAGHHGSNTSSGDQLLGYIKPEYTIISAGKDNKLSLIHI